MSKDPGRIVFESKIVLGGRRQFIPLAKDISIGGIISKVLIKSEFLTKSKIVIL
jgi:hypothetical protein